MEDLNPPCTIFTASLQGHSVFFGSHQAAELPPYQYIPLKDIAKGNYEGFSGNTVAHKGFGAHVGTRATHMDLFFANGMHSTNTGTLLF